MGKYDILVNDAKLNLDLAKRKKSILEKDHEKAWMKVIDAENKLASKEDALINMEKRIRSLASKLSWARRKNK